VGRHPGIEGNLLDFVSGQKPLRNELADGRNGGFTYVEITDNYPILVAASPLPVIREQAERFRRYLADDANEFGRNWLEEQQRRLDAVHSYVKSRQVRAEVSQCQRWVELRIGEWLGPAKEGFKGNQYSALSPGDEAEIHPRHKHEFRFMAEHKEIVTDIMKNHPGREITRACQHRQLLIWEGQRGSSGSSHCASPRTSRSVNLSF
jgi:hypothetical protein